MSNDSSRRALIGSTGLIGGTLRAQTTFDDLYHSTDIEQIRGRSYDLVVCAGAPAEKWKANQAPVRDRENIERLQDCLRDVSARHVVLVSTVDVYATPVGVDEDSPIDATSATAYGRHRYALEVFMRSHFETTCVRLPGLFGHGIKKNIIYDFLKSNAVDAISPDSVFQFYDLARLWHDMEIARAHSLGVVNFAVEPVTVREVAQVGFGVSFENPRATGRAHYDMRSKYAALFGGQGAYFETREQALANIARFVREWRERNGS